MVGKSMPWYISSLLLGAGKLLDAGSCPKNAVLVQSAMETDLQNVIAKAHHMLDLPASF